MNTPAHVVLNSVVLGGGRWRECPAAIAVGALLPDTPMFLFYGYQKLVLGAPEGHIWSTAYFDPAWQVFFDVFNSLPLIALGALVAWRAGSTPWLGFCASMALHCLADLPLHREDAHAHFFPITSWRFESPLSYWDPGHGGLYFLAGEALLVIVGAVVLARRTPPRSWRTIGGACVLLYLAGGVLAVSMWMGG